MHPNNFITLIVLLQTQIFAWNLDYYSISPDYFVSSIAVYTNRAFLALPRTSCYNNKTNPTLVEASWFTEQLLIRKSPFFIESQIWGNCDHLQDAISLDTENLKPRLWVLDRGNTFCAPKMVIYNLFHKVNYSLEAPDKFSGKFNYLLVDDKIMTNGPRGYVGVDDAAYILVFSLNEFKWWKVNLETDNFQPISTQFLTFDRKESKMFITGGEERGIFSLELTELRNELIEDEETVNVTYLGDKLGASSGLVADFKGGLIYYMPQDYVVVRWDSKKPAQAEYYNILAQSYELLPFVSQLFTGPQNGIWAIANLGPPNNCSYDLGLEKRLVKLLKYNIFN